MKLFKKWNRARGVPDLPQWQRENGGFLGSVVSDTGRVRNNNEDNYLLGFCINERCEKSSGVSMAVACSPAGWNVAGVFDGMGGGEKGELAARLAAQEFRSAARELALVSAREEADRILRRAFLEANRHVLGLRAMYGAYGTTGTVVCTNGSVFKVYHLGDSRAYLLRQQDLFLLTRDHTLARMKIDGGLYREDDPQAERDKHRLTEYIGRDETGESIGPEESKWIPVMAGDGILLCSDGLYDMCDDAQIRQILNLGGNDRAGRLVKQALAQGGMDNVTCLCLDFIHK